MNFRVKCFAAVIVVVWVIWIVTDYFVGEPNWILWLIRAVLTVAMGAGGAVSWSRRPKNVRLVFADGSTEVVHLKYLGHQHGNHTWMIRQGVPLDARGLSAEEMPVDAAIVAMRS